MKRLLLTLAACSMTSVSEAATIQFDLLGRAGPGLLPGNENPGNASTAAGGEFLGGITFDDVSKVISVNVAWGSLNGFADLTGTASAGHIHGLTASAAPASFNENIGVLFNFAGAGFAFNTSASAGSVTGSTVPLNAAQEAGLMAGRMYINIHTGTFPGGEIRGNLMPVPEPSAAFFGMAALCSLALRRRRA